LLGVGECFEILLKQLHTSASLIDADEKHKTFAYMKTSQKGTKTAIHYI